MKNLSLLAIVGPTASGKTGLAIDIAKRCNGEIIAADSRTVYKGLDIGTAKPTMEERQGIPHWGFDLVGPKEAYSVADFKTYADAKIADVRARHKLPILVGGSGLYVDAVLYDFSFAPQNQALRAQLNGLGVRDLQKLIADKGYPMPTNAYNKRHLLRTLERGTCQTTKKSLQAGAVIIGLNPPRELLKQRMADRAQMMLDLGVMDEVRWAYATYPAGSEALTGGVYKICQDALWGALESEAVIEQIVQSDMRLAKRQLTWHKRNPDIRWFERPDAALDWLNTTFGGRL